MSYEQEFDFNSIDANGEIVEPAAMPLSQKAVAAASRPRQWQPPSTNVYGRTLAYALLKVQAKVKPIIEADANNPFAKRKYASLGMILSVIKPVLQENDIVLRQGTEKIIAYGSGQKEYFLPVWMDVYHVPSGESDRVTIQVPLSKNDAQAVGIATTYGRRYLMQSYFSIASMDDDAASAVQKRLDKDEEGEVIKGIIEAISVCKTPRELEKWAEANQAGIQHLSEDALAKCRSAYGDRLRSLQDATQEPEQQKKGK